MQYYLGQIGLIVRTLGRRVGYQMTNSDVLGVEMQVRDPSANRSKVTMLITILQNEIHYLSNKSDHQGYIYLIKNTVQIGILLNMFTV